MQSSERKRMQQRNRERERSQVLALPHAANTPALDPEDVDLFLNRLGFEAAKRALGDPEIRAAVHERGSYVVLDSLAPRPTRRAAPPPAPAPAAPSPPSPYVEAGSRALLAGVSIPAFDAMIARVGIAQTDALVREYGDRAPAAALSAAVWARREAADAAARKAAGGAASEQAAPQPKAGDARGRMAEFAADFWAKRGVREGRTEISGV